MSHIADYWTVEAKELVQAQYRSQGYVILSGIFNAEAIACIQTFWHKLGQQRAGAGKRPYATLLMPHISFPEVAQIVRHKPLVHAVEMLLQDRVELIQSQLMHGAPGTKGFSPHQDNYYNRPEGEDNIIAAWIALEDVDEENGGVALYPGSHMGGAVQLKHDWWYLLTRLPDVCKAALLLLRPSQRSQVRDSGVIERFVYARPVSPVAPVIPAMAAGSVLFMHGNLIHGSGPNKTDSRFRRSLLTNYVRKGTHFIPGLSQRTPFEVYSD